MFMRNSETVLLNVTSLEFWVLYIWQKVLEESTGMELEMVI